VSRIGLKPIEIPKGTKVNIDGNNITVEGIKGKLSQTIEPQISVTIEDDKLLINRPSDDRNHRSLHGLTRTLVANMVNGVTTGFQKNLEINGVGYRAQKSEKGLTFQIGFCHPVEFILPPGIEAVVEGNNKIAIKGIDKELVGQTAARIREIRRADGYKRKGIIYAGERLRLKPGKAGKTSLKK
jgi:large subunit ribosomal protein L6